MTKMTSAGHQGAKRAIAVALACPLRVQAGIYRLLIPPPRRPVVRVMQLQKLRPSLGAMAMLSHRVRMML
jgi:hypothetical protein